MQAASQPDFSGYVIDWKAFAVLRPNAAGVELSKLGLEKPVPPTLCRSGDTEVESLTHTHPKRKKPIA
jgi:hypothetical protein